MIFCQFTSFSLITNAFSAETTVSNVKKSLLIENIFKYILKYIKCKLGIQILYYEQVYETCKHLNLFFNLT